MLKKRIAVLIGLALILLCAAALADTAINETNFPDANFRKAVSAFDLNKNNSLDEREILRVKDLYINAQHIKNLKGIEVFTGLEILDCSENELTSLDLSKNTQLKTLICEKNQLTSLNLSKNLSLTYLYCYRNQLTSLNLGQNTVLKRLTCSNNKLTSLNLRSCPNLEEITCTYCQLTSLDLSGMKKLVSLACFDNKLTQLNLKGCSSLTSLTCNANQLTSLDVSDCSALTFFGCDYNRLTSLKLSKHPLLEVLYCYSNAFTQLDVRGCPILCGYMKQYRRELDPSNYDTFGKDFRFDSNVTVLGDFTSAPLGNGIAIDASNFPDDAFRAVVNTFDQDKDHYLSAAEIAAVKSIDCVKRGIVSLKGVEHFTALEILLCSGNTGLTSPDLSKNTALTRLEIDNCPIRTLDVTKLANLVLLNCFNDGLTSLDVSRNPKLENLDCWANSISVLDLSKNPNLSSLGISENPIRSLNLRNNTELLYLYCRDCPLSSLDLSKCVKLDILCCYNNNFNTLDVRNCPELCTAMNTSKRTYDQTKGYDYFGYQIMIGTNYKLIGDYESIHGKEPTRITAQDGIYSLSRTGAALLKPAKSSLTSLVIADELQANGKTYKVIGVSSKACKGMSKLAEVTLGKYVKVIDKNAFNSCRALKTVKGGSSVTAIGESAFANCVKLAVFPQMKKLKEIGNAAFGKCASLVKFYLGTAVNFIGKGAFQYCKSLKAITIKTTKLTKKNVGKNAFSGIFEKAVFKCPKGKAKAYAVLLRACGAPATAIFQ